MAKCPFSDWPAELACWTWACSVRCAPPWAWGVLERSWILSWVMLWMQASAGLCWCKVSFWMVERWWDKWAGGLKVLTVPCCPLSWDVFSVIFSSALPTLIVRSTLLRKLCKCLLGFARPFDCSWVMLRAALFWWTPWMPEMCCSFSAAFLEVLEYVRLKGKGLVNCFSFLVLPCR